MSTTLKIAGGIVLGFLVLFIGCAALITAGEETVDEPTVNEPTQEGGGEGEQEGEPAQAAAVGDTLTLEGFEGLTLDVTLEEIDEDLELGEFDEGDYVGVRLAMENTGDTAYDDSPSNGATLVTSDDQQITSTILSGGDCSGSESVRIAAGDTRDVCIPFEAASGTSLRLFQFALDSGFADQTGEWELE